MTTGWAVVDCGKIDIDTVASHRRASIVNWLVTRKDVIVTCAFTDDMIEDLWHALSTTEICTTVEIKVAQ